MDTVRKISDTLTKDGDKAMERVREVADSAWEKGRDTWNELGDQGKEAFSVARKNSEEAWDDAQKLVQKHPGKSVGIAMMVGAAIGALLVVLRRND